MPWKIMNNSLSKRPRGSFVQDKTRNEDVCYQRVWWETDFRDSFLRASRRQSSTQSWSFWMNNSLFNPINVPGAGLRLVTKDGISRNCNRPEWKYLFRNHWFYICLVSSKYPRVHNAAQWIIPSATVMSDGPSLFCSALVDPILSQAQPAQLIHLFYCR